MTSKKYNFEFEDFLSEEIEIEAGVAIDPKAKMINFAKIKVAAIDPKIQNEIDETLTRIHKNLRHLKLLVQE